jgi:hypothetical protein
MIFATYTLLFFGCSLVMSGLAFLAGRCARRLPIDGQLPRVVGTARFDSGDDQQCTTAPSDSRPTPPGAF